MSTLADLRTNVSNYLNRNDLDTEIDLAINRAITYFSRKNRFWFNETNASFNTVTAQMQYTTASGLPTNILKLDDVTITLNANCTPTLTPRTLDWVLERNISGVVGTPTDYAWYESSMYIYTPPDQVYAINLYYLKNYAALVNDTDTNDFTENCQDLIEARASWFIYSRILKNREAAGDSKNDENDALAVLIKQTQRLIGTGKVVPTKF